MTRSRQTMSTRLIQAFVGVALLPLAVAALVGVNAFSTAMDGEALRRVDDHMIVARRLLSDRLGSSVAAVEAAAGEESTVRALQENDRTTLVTALGQANMHVRSSILVAVDRHGRALASQRGRIDVALSDDPLVRAGLAGATRGTIEVVPKRVLDAFGLTSDVAIPVKETPGGTRHRETVSGALAIGAVTPVRSADGRRILGALVSFDIINRSSTLVDEIVLAIGGEATVFQDEVRISTTVLGLDGKRAIGTVAADKVQKAVLEKHDSYRGTAFVVRRDLLTAYEPLRSASGRVVGMLFVGLPLDPYAAAKNSYLLRLAVALVVGIALALIAGIAMSRVVAGPVSRVSDAARLIADGDLTVTVPVTGNRETAALSESFNLMTRALSGVIADVDRAAGHLAGVASDIASSTEQQAASTGTQASAVAEMTATLEEMVASYGSVAAAADEVMRLAEDALEAAQGGETSLAKEIEDIQTLRGGADATASSAHELARATTEIGEVLGIIDNIAARTKILALNAAIEAARAGEAGKGFSVVAAEIRSLADSVTDSTARIEETVGSIQRGTSGLASKAENHATLAGDSVEMVSRTGSTFSDIVEQMAATASAARQIAAAAAQQRTASDQILGAMLQVNNATDENARAARDVADSVRDLDGESRKMRDNLRGFRL
ncbi:MAG: methyl-accepting chemotaxis protein [Coriobacteriia bacterium]